MCQATLKPFNNIYKHIGEGGEEGVVKHAKCSYKHLGGQPKAFELVAISICEVVEIDPAYPSYHSEPRAKGTDPSSTVSRAAIFMRPRLTDSNSSTCSATSSECMHPTLKHQGNASARWWTCIA